ncbi:fibronectin type III domain-containing protein [Cohnella sp. LGH]|uniref:fibronectin type III domain-containing protein n=1 Tax=Cohnella sp. LGH TaxID=1619153 RepID=UPI0035301413
MVATSARDAAPVGSRVPLPLPESNWLLTAHFIASTAKTQTSVTLAWGASTYNFGVTGYDVYNGSTLSASVNSTTLTAVISNLTPSTTYTFTVIAKDAASNISAASNALTVTTDAPAAAA